MRITLGRWSILVLLVLFVSGCGWVGLAGGGCEDLDAIGLRDLLQPTLPAGAVIVEERCNTGFNPSYAAVFTMPADQLTAFQASTPITDWRPDLSARTNDRFGAQAAEAQSFLYGEYGDGAIYLTVFIDTSAANVFTVHYRNTFVD